MPFRLAQAIGFGFFGLLVLSSCGGSTSGAGGGPKSENDVAGGKSQTGSDGASEGEEGEESESSAPVSRCADGTCFECGAGLCPKGFYCDEGAPGGAACSWLPEC